MRNLAKWTIGYIIPILVFQIFERLRVAIADFRDPIAPNLPFKMNFQLLEKDIIIEPLGIFGTKDFKIALIFRVFKIFKGFLIKIVFIFADGGIIDAVLGEVGNRLEVVR